MGGWKKHAPAPHHSPRSRHPQQTSVWYQQPKVQPHSAPPVPRVVPPAPQAPNWTEFKQLKSNLEIEQKEQARLVRYYQLKLRKFHIDRAKNRIKTKSQVKTRSKELTDIYNRFQI